MVEDLLMLSSKLSGFNIYDESEYCRIVKYQIENGQFEFVEYEGKVTGFFGWLTKKTDDGMCVCINNLFVLKKYRDHFNIFDMCKFFKEKYSDIYKLEWHNQKKDEFKELILKNRSK